MTGRATPARPYLDEREGGELADGAGRSGPARLQLPRELQRTPLGETRQRRILLGEGTTKVGWGADAGCVRMKF
jgi:hypothetical protein